MLASELARWSTEAKRRVAAAGFTLRGVHRPPVPFATAGGAASRSEGGVGDSKTLPAALSESSETPLGKCKPSESAAASLVLVLLWMRSWIAVNKISNLQQVARIL